MQFAALIGTLHTTSAWVQLPGRAGSQPRLADDDRRRRELSIRNHDPRLSCVPFASICVWIRIEAGGRYLAQAALDRAGAAGGEPTRQAGSVPIKVLPVLPR